MSNLSDLIGGGGGGAMELISTTTISGSPTVIDITSGFSSTYDNYVLYATDFDSGNVRLRVYKGGTLDTGTNYRYNEIDSTNYKILDRFDIHLGTSGTASGFMVQITSANDTHATFFTNGKQRGVLGGYNDTSGAVTGLRFYDTTFTAGTIKLYGIKT